MIGAHIILMDRIALLIRRDEEFLLFEKEGEWRPILRQIEKGETLREAVRNETKELTGADIEFVDKITKNEIGDGNERVHWYVAGEKSPTEEDPDPAKVNIKEGNYEWCGKEEIMEKQLNGHLQDFMDEHGEKIVEA